MRIGALFSGMGGLELGIMAALGGGVAWHSEIDPAACKVLAYRFPGVPNHGDITKVDWTQVEPVDVLCGGSPCQDVSHAGKRAGMKAGTRSGLWASMCDAIDALRPPFVVWENVRGVLSAEADSALEPCAGCVGDRDDGPVLRALGRVLGDLAGLGYDCRWHGLRAADIGAPHGRFRVFVVAHSGGLRRRPGWCAGPGEAPGGWSHDHAAGRRLLPTPRATDGTKGGPNQRGSSGDLMLPSAAMLLSTPAVNDMGEGKTVEAWDEWTAKMQAAHGNGNGHGKSLSIEAQRLLPTPNAADAWVPMEATENTMRRGDPNGSLRSTSGSLPKDLGLALDGDRRGIYADAIARWEALTRPAPAPTQPSKKGTPQLSPAFSEWMMGLPAGWVTDVPGLTRNDMLRILGNGVVPQQAALALRMLLAGVSEVAA